MDPRRKGSYEIEMLGRMRPRLRWEDAKRRQFGRRWVGTWWAMVIMKTGEDYKADVPAFIYQDIFDRKQVMPVLWG